MTVRRADHSRPCPSWLVWCAWACVVAALPTVLWRALVGLGFTLGTPASWRAAEQIPGRGVHYVLTLSALELLAALAAPLLLTRPVRRLPWWLPALLASAGEVALVGLIGLSILHWDHVDPFRGQPASAWSVLCLCCYLLVLVWPVALVGLVTGWIRWRRGVPTQT